MLLPLSGPSSSLRPTAPIPTDDHAALSAAIIVLLGSRSNVIGARVYTSDLRIRVPATGFTTHADASVIWGRAERDPDAPGCIVNPAVIVEVIDAASDSYAREVKWSQYKQLEALSEYVLVTEGEQAIEVFARDGGAWTHTMFGPGEVVSIPSIGVLFGVDEVYDAAGM